MKSTVSGFWSFAKNAEPLELYLKFISWEKQKNKTCFENIVAIAILYNGRQWNIRLLLLYYVPVREWIGGMLKKKLIG